MFDQNDSEQKIVDNRGFSGLEQWYKSRCNGDWEHQYGIKIDTLDNPGWMVEIDLRGTQAEDRTLDWTKISRSEDDWIHYRVEKSQFMLACGPLNLSEAAGIFLEWFEQSG